MKFLNRKLLYIIVGILVLINIFSWIIYPIFIQKDVQQVQEAKPQVRLVVNGTASSGDKQTMEDYASDKDLSDKFSFAIIDSKNKDRLNAHVTKFGISGTKEVIITNRKGDKVFKKFPNIPTKEELIKLSEK